MEKKLYLFIIFTLALGLSLTGTAAAKIQASEHHSVLLASGLQGAQGSTIGPDGALYVTEGAAGMISRIDPQTGERATFASGLPPALIPIGGVVDVAFIDGTAYALVTMVGDDMPFFPVNNGDVVGIYRVDGPNSFTAIADIGMYSIDNPSQSIVFIPSGVQYALEPFRGGFLVTDGHHNRVLWVTLDGEVSELMAFGNIVPTGLEVRGNRIYMAEAGPNPHMPADGKVVMFEPDSSSATVVASGAPLAVDVEYGLGNKLYALAQGDFPEGSGDGSPALPNTGSLVEVNGDGSFSVIVDGLNQPTSLEFIGNSAFVVTLGGEVWRIDNISKPPYGK
jgi:hypothetical protein